MSTLALLSALSLSACIFGESELDLRSVASDVGCLAAWLLGSDGSDSRPFGQSAGEEAHFAVGQATGRSSPCCLESGWSRPLTSDRLPFPKAWQRLHLFWADARQPVTTTRDDELESSTSAVCSSSRSDEFDSLAMRHANLNQNSHTRWLAAVRQDWTQSRLI